MFQTLFKYGPADVSTCVCPRCGTTVPASDINVGADTALCRGCGSAFRFSSLVDSGAFVTYDLSSPPDGASFQLTGDGFRASGSTRSYEAWSMIPFMCVWSGVSLGGIYGSQIHKGVFDLVESLFGIPFILGTLWFGTYALMRSCGRVVVTRNADQGSVFEGVGPFGWTRRFRWSDIESAIEAEASYGPRGCPKYRLIMLNFKAGSRRSIRFGTLLSEERRWFLASVVRSQLSPRSSG